MTLKLCMCWYWQLCDQDGKVPYSIYTTDDTRIFRAPSLLWLLLSRLLRNKTIICNIFVVINLCFTCLLMGDFACEKHLIVPSRLSVCLPVRPFAWHISVSVGRIFVKFCTGEFYSNLHRKFTFGSNRTQTTVQYMNRHVFELCAETHKQFCSWGGICSLWGAKWGWNIRLSSEQLL